MQYWYSHTLFGFVIFPIYMAQLFCMSWMQSYSFLRLNTEMHLSKQQLLFIKVIYQGSKHQSSVASKEKSSNQTVFMKVLTISPRSTIDAFGIKFNLKHKVFQRYLKDILRKAFGISKIDGRTMLLCAYLYLI